MAASNGAVNHVAVAPPRPEPVPPVAKQVLPVAKPVSKTRLGPRQGSTRSSITHLARDPLEDTTQQVPEPPVHAVGEDEIDLLATDLGIDLEIPKAVPPSANHKATPNMADPIRVQSRLSQAEASPEVPAVQQHQATIPTPPEKDSVLPAAEQVLQSALDARRKKRRLAARPAKARQRTSAPAEIEPGDVVVVDEKPIAESIEMQSAGEPKPLSYQSAEHEAATALLDDSPEEPEVQEIDPAMSEGGRQPAHVESAPRPYIPVAMPQMAAVIPRPPTPPEGPAITIDGKKVLQYAVPVLVVAALVFGIFYLFIGRGPRRLSVYEVEGVVLFNGEVEGARVTLFPEFSKKHRYFPTGKVEKDGKFKLTTYAPADGAPAGRYKVKIVRGEMDVEQFAKLSNEKNPEEIQRIAEEMARDPLFAKFANPSTSGLSAEIIAGKSNRLEFKLD